MIHYYYTTILSSHLLLLIKEPITGNNDITILIFSLSLAVRAENETSKCIYAAVTFIHELLNWRMRTKKLAVHIYAHVVLAHTHVHIALRTPTNYCEHGYV